MQADKFNTLLKYSEIEHQGGDDYVLANEENDQFYFWFDFSYPIIKDKGSVELTETQIQRIEAKITDFCNNKLNEIDQRRRDILEAPDDLESGIYCYGN